MARVEKKVLDENQMDKKLLTEEERVVVREKARKKSRLFIDAMTHINKKDCTNLECLYPYCRNTKNIFVHMKNCPSEKTNCGICRDFIVILWTHSMRCSNTKCSVTLCDKVKEYRKMKQRQRARDQTLLLNRLAGMTIDTTQDDLVEIFKSCDLVNQPSE